MKHGALTLLVGSTSPWNICQPGHMTFPLYAYSVQNISARDNKNQVRGPVHLQWGCFPWILTPEYHPVSFAASSISESDMSDGLPSISPHESAQ